MAAAGTTSGTEKKKKKRDGDDAVAPLSVCLGDKAERNGFCILLCFRVSHPQMHQTLISNDSESTIYLFIYLFIK